MRKYYSLILMLLPVYIGFAQSTVDSASLELTLNS